MSKLKLMGRFSALESDVPESSVDAAEDIPQDVLETAVDTEVDGTETVEGHALEAEEAEADVVEADGAAEDLQETSEALESYLEIVQDARLSRRGLTKGEAHILYVGINNAVKKVGLDVGDIAGNVSVESFDGGRDSLGRCASLENAITDAIKKFWEAIKNQISKMVKYVRDWWLKHLDGAARMKKKAEKLKEKADKTNGSAKEKKIPISSHRLLSDDKKAGTAQSISNGLEATTKLITELTNSRASDSFSSNLDEIETAVSNIFDSETETNVNGIATAKNTSKLGFAANTVITVDGDQTDQKIMGVTGDDGLTVSASAKMPGYKKFYSITVADLTGANLNDVEKVAENYKKAGDKSRISVRYATEKVPEIDASADYLTLSPSQAASLCDEVINMCDAVMKYRQNFDKYEKATKNFLSKMDNIYKKSTKSAEGEAVKNMSIGKKLGQGAASYVRNQTSSITAVVGYGMGLGRGTLSYVQSSLSQYKD